jgi:hypothetical protein
VFEFSGRKVSPWVPLGRKTPLRTDPVRVAAAARVLALAGGAAGGACASCSGFSAAGAAPPGGGDPAPRGRLQQHQQRPGAAFGRLGLHEGQHLGLLDQPALHLALEHRRLARRAQALAMHHAHAAQARLTASRMKVASASRASSVRRPCRSSWRWMLHSPRRRRRVHVRADAGAAKAQLLIGLQQRADVELIADGFAQHGLVVALLLRATGSGGGSFSSVPCAHPAAPSPRPTARVNRSRSACRRRSAGVGRLLGRRRLGLGQMAFAASRVAGLSGR